MRRVGDDYWRGVDREDAKVVSREVEREELIEELRKLEGGKAAGPDGNKYRNAEKLCR